MNAFHERGMKCSQHFILNFLMSNRTKNERCVTESMIKGNKIIGFSLNKRENNLWSCFCILILLL